VPFDEESAIQAGLLYSATHTAGLSSGDRACLALAMSKNAVAVTTDRAWQAAWPPRFGYPQRKLHNTWSGRWWCPSLEQLKP
jgi:hypothetical protein